MTREQVAAYIRDTIRQSGRPASAWAAEIGVSRAYLYLVTKGERPPSEKVLKRFNLEREAETRVTYTVAG